MKPAERQRSAMPRTASGLHALHEDDEGEDEAEDDANEGVGPPDSGCRGVHAPMMIITLDPATILRLWKLCACTKTCIRLNIRADT